MNVAGKPNGAAVDEDTDLNLIDAGEEIAANVLDDAERDALAAAEAEGKPKTAAEIQAEMLAAMNGEDEPPPAADDKAPKTQADDKAPNLGPDGKPLAEKPTETPAADDPEAAKKAAEEQAAAAKAEVEKEADALNLKGKSRQRFHELNDGLRQANEQLQARDAQIATLLGAGDPADTRPVLERLEGTLKQHREFEDVILNTFTPEDFKNVAGYKAAIASDDPAQWENARKFLQQELTWLETQRMGIRAPEGQDLLDGHPDLMERVKSGALDRADAEAWARDRNQQKAAAAARSERGVQTAAEKAIEQATNDCVEFANIQGKDAAQWAAKWKVLEPKIAEIKKTLPPERWAERIAFEYARIPYTPAAPQKQQQAPAPRQRPRPGAQPARGGGGRPGGAPPAGMVESHDEESPFEALLRGMKEAAPKA